MEVTEILAEWQVTHFEDTDSTVVVTSRKNLTSVVTVRSEWNIEDTSFECSYCTYSDIALTQYFYSIHDTTNFRFDDCAFQYYLWDFTQVLVAQHRDNLLSSSQTASISFLSRYTVSFVWSLNDNLSSLRQCSCSRTPRDYTECLRFILWETTHPLVEYGCYTNIIVTILVEVFASQLSQRTHSSDILDQVTALAITYCDILHTLFSSQQSFDYCNSVRDTWRNQCTSQRTERFAVDAYTSFFVHTYQAVAILPVLDSLFDRVILRIRDVIRNTTTFVRSKTT